MQTSDPATKPPDRFESECEIEFVRAGGPGGQHRNKVETGVRITHLPTGITAMATERRSRERNRKTAIERLWRKIQAARKTQKPRVARRKSSSVRRRELDDKHRQAEKKKLRKRPPVGSADDDA